MHSVAHAEHYSTHASLSNFMTKGGMPGHLLALSLKSG